MSYWCGEQIVVTLDGPTGRSVVSLAQPFARVGSHPAADVVLADPSVAPRYFYLHATPAGVFCLYLDVETPDLQQKGIWLRPDQEVQIGQYRLRAALLTAEPGDTVPEQSLAGWGSTPPPLPVMMVYCGKQLKDKRRFRAQLNPVGRRPQCALQLKGFKVSGFHCVLFWERQQLWCVDLNSSNGVQLNGQPLVCGRVELGDRVEVGEFGLVFQRLSSGRAAAEVTQQPTAQERTESPQSANWQPPSAASAPDQPHPREASQPSSAELARDDAQAQLREQMAQEVARLANERADMHRQWELSSQQLVAQISQLHAEAAHLTGERQALEQSRQEWQAERAALAEQMTRRSDDLARLESELAAATRSLTERLAEVESRAAPTGPLPAELAREAEQRQGRELLAAEVARLAQEREEMHRHWEQASQQLLAQIGQLHDEAGRLSGERQALEQSRQEWQGERIAASAAEQVAQELQWAVAPPSPSAPPAPPAPQRDEVAETAPVMLPAEVHLPPELTIEAGQPPPALSALTPIPALVIRDRDQLTSFVSDKLVDLDQADRRRQFVWWSLGGICLVAVIALAVTIWIWIL